MFQPVATSRGSALSLRQAALVAGLTYLLNPVSYAEYSAHPRLVIPGNIEQTCQNITAHPGLLVTAIFCYLISFAGDVVLAWALYLLLAPVNRAVSLLSSLFQLVYAAMALVAVGNLTAVYRMLTRPEYMNVFGAPQLHAQTKLLLDSFHWDWSLSLILFGIHLAILGCLIALSSYIPKVIGVLMVIDGLAWIVDGIQPYLFSDAHLGYLPIAFMGEVVFMLWLLIRGWRIPEPSA